MIVKRKKEILKDKQWITSGMICLQNVKIKGCSEIQVCAYIKICAAKIYLVYPLPLPHLPLQNIKQSKSHNSLTYNYIID